MNLIAYISLGTSFLTMVLVVVLIMRGKKVQSEEKMTEDMIIRQAKRKSNTIIAKAIERADTILAQAHLKGADHIRHHEAEGVELEEKYKQQLDHLLQDLTKQLEESEKKAEESYAQFLEELANSVKSRMENNRDSLSDKADDVMKKTEEYIKAFIDDIHGQIKEEVKSEVHKTRDALDEYKKARMSVVDENIADILERAYKQTLGKALPIKEQADLAYQALEQAKHDGFFKVV